MGFIWWEESCCKQQFVVAVTKLCPFCHAAGLLWCSQDGHVHLRCSVAGIFQYSRLSSLEKSFLFWEWLSSVDLQCAAVSCFRSSLILRPSDTFCLPLSHRFSNPVSTPASKTKLLPPLKGTAVKPNFILRLSFSCASGCFSESCFCETNILEQLLLLFTFWPFPATEARHLTCVSVWCTYEFGTSNFSLTGCFWFFLFILF